MRRYQNLGMILLAASLVAAVVVSCTRQTPPLASPLPVYTSTVTATPTITHTPPFTSTITNSPTQTNSPTPVFSPTYTTSPTNTFTATYTTSSTSTYTITVTATPTSTDTTTNTVTVTNTETQTLTPTTTDTPTGTSTITLTLTPTVTGTPTATPTITLTPAVTSTSTPSATQTGTSTPTLCVPVLQATYTFATDTQCWTAWGPLAAVVGLDSTTTAPGSTNSLEIIIPAITAGQQYPIGLNFGPTNGQSIPAESTVSLWYKVSPNLSTAPGILFTESGPTPSWDNNSQVWIGTLSSTWTSLTMAVSATYPNQVDQIGFEVPGNNTTSTTSPVTIWIDAVTFTAANTPTITATLSGYTPTITATPTTTSTPGGAQGFVFNSSSAISPWGNNTYATSAGISPVSLIFNPTYTGCLSSSTGAMEITIGFTAINQAAFIQDNLSSVTDMSGKTITAIFNVTSGWNSDAAQIYGGVFAQEGSSNLGIGAAYSEDNLTAGFWSTNSTPTNSGCVTVSLTLPATGTSGGFDPTHVATYGIQIGSGGGWFRLPSYRSG